MPSLGGYGDNVLVEVEDIEDGLVGIKSVGEAILVCNHVFVFNVSMFGV